jgi:hypothetical protein
MREFIEQEKKRLQNLLRLFNEHGSRVEIYGEDGVRFLGDLVDSYTVTRIAPHFDAKGKHTGSDFWLIWKSVGYNNGWQYAHTTKIVKVRVEDTLTHEVDGVAQQCWLIVDLTDDRGRRMHVELIEPITERAYAADWREWQRYKAENAALFAEIDADLLKEHLQIAEEWK